MSLPIPNLDDRDFQSIVDDAKRLIPRFCPEWTNHNVSDPGVALIELFAWMSEYMLFRLNQVPDVFYTRMLNLLGEDIFPATAARTNLTFWLLDESVVSIPAGTEVATLSETEEPIVFATLEPFDAGTPRLRTVQTAISGGDLQPLDTRLQQEAVPVFPSLAPGAGLYLGFDQSLAGSVLDIEVTVESQGIGVDPTRPPIRWQVYGEDTWIDATVMRDTSGGFNRDGFARIAIPMIEHHAAPGTEPLYWLRVILVDPEPGQPAYRSVPAIRSVEPHRIAVSVPAEHSASVLGEVLGTSDGRPDQRFHTRFSPVLRRRAGETVEVVTLSGETQQWEEVTDFQESGEDSRHFQWDNTTGEIRFGPRLRYADGEYVQHGALPEPKATIRVNGYRHGGGQVGNVPAGALTQLRSSIAGVDRVENLESAAGGTDAETVENAKVRGPMSMRAAGRAVTAEDYERLTRIAAPSIARVRAVAPDQPGGPVRLLLVPEVKDEQGREPSIDAFALDDGVLQAVEEYLSERRVLGTVVELGAPFYQGVSVAALVHPGPNRPADVVRDRVLNVIYDFIHPVTGGPDGTGWPWDGDLNSGMIGQIISEVEGVERVDDVALFHWDARNGTRVGQAMETVRLQPRSIFLSGTHRVVVR